VELDRALDNVYKIDIQYNEVFCDFDDCLTLNEKNVNAELVSFLYQCFNENRRLTLLTRHKNGIENSLKKIRLNEIFDRIIQINHEDKKSAYIDNKNSIFIDDSFSERLDVSKSIKIPVFSVDMINCLFKS
jgi:hypothetical protein